MKTCDPCSRAEQKQNGFTLTDLSVILAVIALLVCFCATALARATGQTKRAQCASNLRQFTLAMHIFANENDDRLPIVNGGFWLWDVPPSLGTFVESTGSRWTVMYCPGTEPRFTEAMNWQLYNFSIGYRVIGYSHTFPGNSTLISTNQNSTLTPQPILIGFNSFATPLPSERVMLADATISQPGQNNELMRDTYNYVQIAGGYSPAHSSPHLTGKLPAGGNLGMLDGHVEWRKFTDMHIRTSSGNTPGFWW